MKQNLLFNRASAFGMRFIMVLTMLLVVGIGQAWGATETLAEWTFTSSSYPKNKTNFEATSGTCKTGSTFYLNGSGSAWNTSKGYAFTAVTDITITIKLSKAIAAGSKVTFSADMFYNKASNAPMKGFSISASEKNNNYSTTGLSVTTISLSTSSSNKSVTYTTQNALSKDETIKLKYTGTGKAGSGQGYFNNIQVVEEIADAPSFSVSATSNNNSYGTVSVSGTTITATPNDGYRVKSGDAGYTVTSGTAVVTNNGNNTFSVTPSSDCTITINFEAIPKYTVTLNAGPGTCAASVTEASAGAGVTLPTPTLNGCDDWSFAGWATSSVANETSSKPATLLTGSYKPTANTTLYAVYQRTEDGGGSSEYSKLNWGSNIKAGKYLISTGIYTVTGKNGNKTSELAVVDYTPSTEQKTNYEFTISEPDNDGYFTIKLPDNSCWVGWSTSTSTALSETEPSDDQYLWKYSSNGIQNKEAITRYLQVNGACTAAKVYTTDNPGTNWKHTYLYSFSSGSTIYYHSTPDCTTETVVTLNPNGGTFASTPYGWTQKGNNYVITHTGTEITLPTNISLEGKIFEGWYDDSDNKWESIPAEQDESITLTAKWSDKQDPEIAWNPTTCTVTIDAGEELPIFQNPNELTDIAFESSNPTVASVDDKGIITLGTTSTTATVTITATFAGNTTYAAKEATCTLTVNPSNCRWVEVEIGDIEPEDEVVVTMKIINSNGEIAYQALGTETIRNSPKSQGVNVTSGVINPADNSDFEFSKYSWSISTVTGGYTLQPYGMSGTYLYGVSSYISIGNNTENNIFLIYASQENDNKCFAYVRDKAYYVGYGMEDGNGAWKRFESYKSVLNNQTLKFYKRECLDSEHYWVTWDAGEGTWEDGSSNKLQSYQVGAPITAPAETPTREGYRFDGWTPAPTTMPAKNTTFTAKWTEVYTINFYSNGTQYGSSQEVEASEIVTLPMTDPTSCDANYSHFFGWTEIPIDGVSNTQPTDLIQEDFTPTRSMNLHAVFVDELPQLGGWELVTSTEGLIEGDIYTISSTNSTSSGYVFGQQKENNRAAVSWKTGTPVELTLGGSIDEWTLYDAAYDNGAGGYLYAASSSKNYLRTMLEITDNAKWHISFSNQKVTITAQGSYTRNTIRYNSSDANNLLFSCYDQDAGNVYLFKRAVGTTPNGYITNCCTPWEAPRLSASPSSISVGETTTITHSGTAYGVVTYTSNDKAIATVDANGKVTGVKPGKTTITASWDGVDGSGNYCPAEATIDVTVIGSFTITYDANHASATGATTATTIAYPTGQGTVATNGFALAEHQFVKWNTSADGSGTSYSEGASITLTDDITLYAIWQRYCTITYVIPAGGGTLAAGATTTVVAGGAVQMPGIENNSIDLEYSCEELIGWTTNSATHEAAGLKPDPFYAIGASLSGITQNTTLYAVYSRAGEGASGTVELTCTDVSTWKSNVLSGNNNTYGTVTTRTAADGSVWKTNGQILNAGGIDLKENYYIQIPTLPGPATSITMKVSQGNIGSGEDACTDNVASPTSRAFYFRSADNGSNLFTSETTSSRSRTINITEGNYTTGYIINGEGTSHVHSVTVAYGSPNIISTSLNCSNDIDEFTITYNTNYGSAIGQIPTGTVVNGACDNSGEPIRFEDLPNGEYTICNSLTATQYKLVGWNSQANGNGGLSYEPGDVITMVPQSDITLYAQWVPEVIMLDNQDRTITYQETVGEAITLPVGAYTCDGKYTFVGWTTDNVDSWNQKITKPTLVAELDGNDETLFIPDGPTVVYAVYKLESTANSKAFYLKSGNYYAQKHNTYVLKGTSDIADATRLYRQQINVESPNNYWLYYLDDEQQKRFVYINTANLGSLFIPSIGDGETTPEDTEGWEFVSVTGGYKLKALGNYDGSTQYMRTADSGNMGSNTTGSVYTIETATEINYYAYPTCSDEITITFETRGGTLIPNDHPYVLTKKEGDVITLPGCEYAGLDFIGWVDEPIEPTEIIANPEDIYEAEEEYVVGNQNIVLYAYYSQTPESAEYDGNSDGEWKIYAFADGEYHFAVAPDSEEGEMSTVTICDKSTTWTFTNVAANQYHIQDEAGRYVGVRPAIEDKNDFRFTDEPVIWTVESKGSDLYRLTCETNTDRVMLYDNGRIRYSSHTQEGKSGYFYVNIGGCFNPIYTTDPARLQAVSVYGTVQITSTLGQTVKAMDKLTLVVRHAEPESYIRFSSPNVTFYDESGNVITTALVESQKQQIPLVVAYTPDVADNSIARPAITVTAKTLNPSTGTYVETNYSVNGRISARSLPADFAIVAKVGNLWYALPSQGLNSTDALVGYPVEVDNQNDPTAVTAVPENADWSLRQVYAGQNVNATKDRFKQFGANMVFVNNENTSLLLSASRTENYLLTDANYTSYQQADNQGLYEWTPATTDLETYTLTNANPESGRDIKLSMNITNIFGVHKQNVATTELRFLPIENRYTQASLQVVEWRENSIVVMYTGNPAQTATLTINGTEQIGTTSLNASGVQKDLAIYELPASGIASKATQRLCITIGTSKKWLTIPYIINNSITDVAILNNTNTTKAVAAVTDVVVLNEATFIAAGTKDNKYTFRNITVYGGGKLFVPASAADGFGIYSLVMRLGTVKDGTYTNSYPQLVMNGKYSNTSGIYLDYITTYERYYALSVPYTVKTEDIKYPAEIYGDNLKSGNKASFALQYYDGAARATGATGWKDFDESGAKPTLTPYQGYTFWGAPRKVSINGGTAQRPKFGIHRIQLTGVGADDLLKYENEDKTINITPYPANRPNDMGWNFLGNPYLAQYGGLSAEDEDVQVGLLEHEMVDGKWTGGWTYTGNLRYVTTTSDGQNYTAVEVDKATFSPFNTFFIQAATNGALSFLSASRAQSLPARHYAAQQETAKEITTGILLTGNDQTDRTGLLIADNFTEEYDFNADLSKFENSGINLYTIGKTGNLAYMAINQALAEQPIPVGYSAPAEGLYTIAFDEDRYDATDISALYLIDYDRNEKTNLLHTDYSFVIAAGTNNQRFALQVAFVPANSTNVEWVGDATIQVGVEGHELILNNLPTDAAVHVFDALGRLMYHTPHAPTEIQLTLPTGYYLVRIADKQHAAVINTVIP